MWKLLVIGILPLLAISDSFLVVPQDELVMNYKTVRSALTPEQEEFLMELLAADEALIEASSRGIVDDILQALSGTGGNIRVNIVGGSQQPQQQQQNQPIPASSNPQPQQPAVNIINPTFTVVGTPNNMEKTLINSTDTASSLVSSAISSVISSGNAPASNPSGPMSDLSPPSSGSSATSQGLLSQASSIVGLGPFQGSSSNTRPASSQASQTLLQGSSVVAGNTQQMQSGNVTTIGGNNNHLFQTISSVIRNSNSRNVTGIVDESLRIATPAPIREFVTGILNVVYCNGIRRLLGRC